MNLGSIKLRISSMLVFLIIFMNFSFWLSSEMNTMVRYFSILTTSLLIIIIRKRVMLSRSVCVAFISIIGIQLISSLVKGAYMGVSTGLYTTVVTAFLFVHAVDEKEFVDVFRKFMIIECICSIIVYVLFLIAPHMFDIFPTITTWRQGKILFKNIYVSVLPVSMGRYYRNFGIFVEPGIHAIVISFAMLEELFHRPTNSKVLLLYIITIITTISTSGIISVAVLMFVFVWNRSKNTKYQNGSKKRNRIILVFLLGGIIFYLLYQSGFVTSYIFEKLSSKDTISGYERRIGYEVMIREFINNPVWGMGMEKAIGTYYVEKNVTMTATVLNWFGIYGIVYGILCFCGVVNFVLRDLKQSGAFKLMLALTIFIILFSQDFSRELIVFIMILYGYKSTRLFRIGK